MKRSKLPPFVLNYAAKRSMLLFVLGLLLGACSPPPNARTAVATPTMVATASAPADEATASATEAAVAAPIGDEEAQQLMNDLTEFDSELVFNAIDRIVKADDQRFNAVFIELIRAAQIGIVEAPQETFAIALEMLSGEGFGGNWPAWIEWYGATDFAPPPGFTSWKGELLGQIDPEFANFLKDEHPSRIRVEEIQWGGVRVDGIPALDQPAMIPADLAAYLQPEDAVFGLVINGDARAYPLRILDWHEMANDTVGGVPVSIAYCTLCGAAIAYDGRASDGNVYDFGSSGFLFRSNKLMYDRQTRTLWNQLTGEPVLGALADDDVVLDFFPIVLTTWAEWQVQHPDTVVLDPETGFNRPYEPGAAYADYFASPELMFPVWNRSETFEDKDQVFAMRLDGIPKAYELDSLTAEQVVNDTLADTNLVLVATRGMVNVSGRSVRQNRDRAYTAGGEVRAYERGDHQFSPADDPDKVSDEQGQLWQVTEEALVSENGETLPRLSGHLAYWFGWYSFFPNTLVYPSE